MPTPARAPCPRPAPRPAGPAWPRCCAPRPGADRPGLRRHAVADRDRPGGGARPPRRGARPARAGPRGRDGGRDHRPARRRARSSSAASTRFPASSFSGTTAGERWESGTLTSPPAPPGVAAARQELPEVLAAAGAPEGLWTEDKGDALAVHTRRAAEPEQALERLRGPLADLAERTGLAVEPGRMVIELRPPGVGQGTGAHRRWPASAPQRRSCTAGTTSVTCLPSRPSRELRGEGSAAWPSAAAQPR